MPITTLLKTVEGIKQDNFLLQLSQLLYPQPCAGCGNPVYKSADLLCTYCIKSLPLTHYEQIPQNPVTNLFAGRLRIARADAMLFFAAGGLVQNIVHAFKYKNRKDLAIFMGKWMGDKLLKTQSYQLPDAIIPLPLYRTKLKKRGYNQAELIAEGLALAWQIPVVPAAVMRTHFTATQTHKSRINRWLNVAEVFGLDNPESLAGKKLLLVDDVITTGATMEACGRQLLQIPNASLSLLSLALAQNI